MLVTVPHLLARPGFEGVAESTAEATIVDASSVVVDYVKPRLDDATPETTPGAVQTVVVAMVRRGIGNPRGVSQESLGDYAYSAAGDGGVATLYMTKREKKIVRRAVGMPSVTSVNTSVDLPVQPSEYPAGYPE